MAEEEVAAPAGSPVPSDHKRKLEDLQPETTESNANSNSNVDGETADTAVPAETENKRPRLDDQRDVPANTNGHQDEQEADQEKETEERSALEDVTPEPDQTTTKDPTEAIVVEQKSGENSELDDAREPPVENAGHESAEEPSKETQQASKDATEPDTSGDKQLSTVETALHSVEVPYDKQDASFEHKQSASEAEITTRRIEVPNNKVGVLIGKAGDTIRYLQYNSGAKIQITRDADADPHCASRSVELIGSLESIEKAEKLMNAVIAEADAGGSPSLVARGLSPAQATVGSEQIQIQVPNEKVGLIIGRGGETIKSLQTKSGARIQVLIPQHLPEGDDSKERTVQVTGDKRQIEIAQELIKEVMNQPIRPSSGGFGQQAYRPPRGSGGPPQWGQRGSHFGHPSAYDYQHRGPYPSHNQPYAPSYGNYPQHMAPRSGYGSGWEQRPHHSFQAPPPHNGGYEYYGGQGGHLSDAPPSTQLPSSAPPHGTGPSPLPSMGPAPTQVNYNYGQPQGQDYGHQAAYSQAGLPQQGYGQGYEESKYENRAPNQHPYAGHVNSQTTYPQTGAQPNYPAPQQYGKPPLYGMPSQGQPQQPYGHPRATQPGEMPYQGSAPAQSYGTNVPTQQPYPYAVSGPSQTAYPGYGSAPAADGYSHPQPASGAPYTQPQPSYGQPAAQPAASYAQVGPTGYASYPSSQPGYPDQQAANNAVYGYQAPQDAGYSSGAAPAYSTAQPSGQPGYGQPTQTQTGYEQSNTQSAGYGAVPATAPAAYGKTLSPQPAAYPQYDSTQVYGAPR
ncbi:far upstream element-binding protein 1-like isoform X1 [Vigna umbellata]|uniref:far upstream element-binding protein 1-like isoform X1 n=1 Tax=Vigna umbellata TaxID=87088 RepID=UPI001F5EEC01|nr:far upstream element-binding protein 1-like isoform X1 [Vigna umbellata]